MREHCTKRAILALSLVMLIALQHTLTILAFEGINSYIGASAEYSVHMVIEGFGFTETYGITGNGGSSRGHIDFQFTFELLDGSYVTKKERIMDIGGSVPGNGEIARSYTYGDLACNSVSVTVTATATRFSNNQTVTNVGAAADIGDVNTFTEHKDASCTEDGYTAEICTVCEEALSNEYHNAGHYNSGVYDEVTLTATCAATGLKNIYCEGCGDLLEENVVISALDHDWDSGAVTISPTYTSPGEKKFTCQRQGCLEKKSEVIPAKTVPTTPIKPTDPPNAGKKSSNKRLAIATMSVKTIEFTPEETPLSGTSEYPADIQLIIHIGSAGYSINSVEQTMDVAPEMVNDCIMVPARFIVEAFGGTVSWDNETKTATFVLGSKTTNVTIGVVSDGMDVAPYISDNRTFVPLKFITETLGCLVSYDMDTKAININI